MTPVILPHILLPPRLHFRTPAILPHPRFQDWTYLSQRLLNRDRINTTHSFTQHLSFYLTRLSAYCKKRSCRDSFNHFLILQMTTINAVPLAVKAEGLVSAA